jgi:hypothetical protein
MKRIGLMVVIAVFGLLALSARPAWATSLSVQSNNAQTQGDGTGHFTGSIDYVYTGGTSATFTVVLNNTTAPGGHDLTGFLFNNPGGKLTSVTESSFGNSNFQLVGLGSPAGQPWGTFGFGAALGGDWAGGGNPNKGIAPGSGGTFTFILHGTAANLSSLDTMSFVDALSSGGGGGKEFMAVRFRGGVNSDKEPGMLSPAPEPSSLVLFGLSGVGLAGAFLFARRRPAVAVS